jgi:hypothetical protein
MKECDKKTVLENEWIMVREVGGLKKNGHQAKWKMVKGPPRKQISPSRSCVHGPLTKSPLSVTAQFPRLASMVAAMRPFTAAHWPSCFAARLPGVVEGGHPSLLGVFRETKVETSGVKTVPFGWSPISGARDLALTAVSGSGCKPCKPHRPCIWMPSRCGCALGEDCSGEGGHCGTVRTRH